MMTWSVAFVGLIAPAMLAGLALLALPIAAHLLNRRARQRLVFPSIMLLSEARASQSQLFRLRRWLLLVLRCLLVALIVLAFSRPLWLEPGAAAASASEGDGAAVVIVFDRSASAGQQLEGLSAMQSLKAAAGRVLDAMEAGTDRANVIFADARPRPALPDMTTNLQAVRQEIDAAQATAHRADLPGAIGAAARMLGGQAGAKRLVIVSDLQASNWSPMLDDAAVWASLPTGTRVTIVPLEGSPAENVGLSKPRLSPHTPIAGQPAQFRVRVDHHGEAARTVEAKLAVAGRTVDRQTLQLQPGVGRDVVFDLRFDQIGSQPLTVQVGEDALAADNQCHWVAHVAERLPVVVIGDDPANTLGSASYFITRALNPFGDDRDRYAVTHLSSGDVTPIALREAAVVVVSSVGRLSEESLQAIHEFVEGGGGVLWFCGQGPVAENLNGFEAIDDAAALPWTVGAKRDLAARGDLLYLAEGDWTAAMLRDFQPAHRTALGRIAFRHTWGVTDVRESARLLLRFDDDTPALGEQWLGAGRVVLANFSPALEDGDLGKYGAFVALVQSAVSELQPAEANADAGHAGHPLLLRPRTLPEAEGGLEVIDPAGQPVGQTSHAGDRRDLRISVDHTDTPGIYTLRQGEDVLGRGAVNVDPRESDLRRVSPERIRAAADSAGGTVVVRRTSEDRPLMDLRGRPLWGWFLAAALGVMAMELALLGFWKR